MDNMTFTWRQKTMLYGVISRAWQRAMREEPVWREMTAREQRLYFRSAVRKAILELPEKTSLWEKLKLWVNGKG